MYLVIINTLVVSLLKELQVAQASLKLIMKLRMALNSLILLLLPPKYWGYTMAIIIIAFFIDN